MATGFMAFALAAVLTFLLTPPVRHLARHLDVIDKPDRGRKRHRRLVPLWGGLALFGGLVPGVMLAMLSTDSGRFLLDYRNNLFSHRLWILFSAALVLMLMGLADDWRPLPPKVKLLLQIIASTLAVSAGFRLESFMLPWGGEWVFWALPGFLLALLWLVMVMNAYNFTDGLDGLASSQAVIMGTAMALGAWMLSRQIPDLTTRSQFQLAAVLAAAAAGAALGFWRFNHFPARIFLGDSGSHLLGFVLSLSALLVIGRAPTLWAVGFVLLVLGWPLLDALQVIFRRLRRQEPVSKADNRHLHHMLIARGFSNSAAVALIDMIVLLFCLIGLVFLWL